MKLYYSALQIELTRRCNQECAHCCRGDYQNVDLTKETIDAFFEKNDIAHIGTLQFSGGEPTLNGKMLEYFVDMIIENNIEVDRFLFGINGLSYSEEFVQGLNKLNDYIIFKSSRKKKCPGWLIISQDQFHKEANPEVVEKLSKLPYLSPIEKTITKERNILPYGRAYQNNLSIQEPTLDNLVNYQKNYHIKEYLKEEYLVISYQYIAANGNVINSGLESYELMDEYALGNVNESKIEDIYLSNSKKILTK